MSICEHVCMCPSGCVHVGVCVFMSVTVCMGVVRVYSVCASVYKCEVCGYGCTHKNLRSGVYGVCTYISVNVQVCLCIQAWLCMCMSCVCTCVCTCVYIKSPRYLNGQNVETTAPEGSPILRTQPLSV